MTMAEYLIMLRGFNKKYWRQYELTRVIAYTNVAPHAKKGAMKSITKWWPLPTDTEQLMLSQARMQNAWQRMQQKETRALADGTRTESAANRGHNRPAKRPKQRQRTS